MNSIIRGEGASKYVKVKVSYILELLDGFNPNEKIRFNATTWYDFTNSLEVEVEQID